MARRLQTRVGKALYDQRKSTAEALSGIFKRVLGFRQFLLRGLRAEQADWALVFIGWNLLTCHFVFKG